MAYSKEVVERFESVLNNPEKHAVGRFDPKDPMVESSNSMFFRIIEN